MSGSPARRSHRPAAPQARVLVADPPWRFGDTLPGPGRGAAKHYAVMSTEAIESFPLPPLAPDAVLFLWRVSAMPEAALRVCLAWGFTPKTELVWVKRTQNGKRHFGMGRIVRAEHETCLIGTRGRPVVMTRSIRSTFEAPVGRHSAKPDAFYDVVRSLYAGSRVELFARKHREGFTCLGNEVEGGG